MRTAVSKGGQFCCSFVANLLKYLYAKNYEHIVRFDKVIAKIIRVQFFASQCIMLYMPGTSPSMARPKPLAFGLTRYAYLLYCYCLIFIFVQ